MRWYEILWMIGIMIPFIIYGLNLIRPTKDRMLFGVRMTHELKKPEVVKRVQLSYLIMYLLGQFCLIMIWFGFTWLSDRFFTWIALMLVLLTMQMYATFFYGHTVCLEFKYVPMQEIDRRFFQLDREDIVIRRELEYTKLIRQEFLIVYVVLFLTAAASLIFYPLIPDMMLISDAVEGGQQVYAEKSIGTVMTLVLVQFAIVIALRFLTGKVAHKKRYVNPAFNMLKKRDRAVRLFIGTMSMITFFCALLMMYLQFSRIQLMPLARSIDVFVYAVVSVCIMTLFIYYLLRINVSEHRFRDYKKEHHDIDDDEHWVGGVFYINPEDNRLSVKNSLRLGRSVNLGTFKGKLYYLITRLIVIVLSFGITMFLWAYEK